MLWNQSHNAVQNTSVVHRDGEPWEHFSLTLPLQRLWSTALHSVPAQCSDTEPPMLTSACFWACLSHDNVWIGFRFLFSSPLSLSSNQVLAAHLWARGRSRREMAGSSDTYSAHGRGCRGSDTPAATKERTTGKRGVEPASKWPLSWKNNNRRPKWGPLSPKSLPHSPESHAIIQRAVQSFYYILKRIAQRPHFLSVPKNSCKRCQSLPARRQHYWETSLKSSASFTNSANGHPTAVKVSVP